MSETKFDPKKYLISMKGRDYLEVKWRIVWFRADHPRGGIMTDTVSLDPLVIKATITDDTGRILATGHGTANAGGKATVWSGREVEKAETAAIGRALASCGYGTQFTDDFNEGDNLADSPIERSAPPQPQRQPAPVTPLDGEADTVELIASQVETKEYTDKKTGELKKRLVYHCANDVKATAFSTRAAKDKGYDVSAWGEVGLHDITPPAVVTVKRKGDFWDAVDVRPSVALGATGTDDMDFLA